MNGHDADAGARRFHVAFDFEIGGFDIIQEMRERENPVLFGVQGLAQKFIDHIAGFRAEPSFDGAAAAVFAQKPRIEIEGRERRASAPDHKFRISVPMARL